MAVAEETSGLGKMQQEQDEQQQEEGNQVAADDVSWLQDVDFMMYKFKVALCNKNSDHDWDLCPYAHIGERTCRRRDPAKVNYTSIICVDMMQKGRCSRGRSCTAAHTIYEYWLHPHRYRTEMCKVGAHCARRVCFFAHKPEELRPLPTHLVGTTGGASSGKYSLSATRQAAAKAAAATRVHTCLPSSSYPPALQQRLHYRPADYGTWAPGTPPAGMMPSSAVFGSVMSGSNFQQPLGLALPELAMLSGAADSGSARVLGQQPFMTEASIIRQMQQMALTGGTASPSGSMSGGMAALQGPARWPGAAALTGAVSHSFGAGQQYLADDSYMLGWQQHQQQQGLQGYGGFGGSMPAPSRMMPMQPPQEQEQQLLLQLLTAQGGTVGKPFGPASAAGQDAFQSIGMTGVAVSGAMVHPGRLAVTQGPWMM